MGYDQPETPESTEAVFTELDARMPTRQQSQAQAAVTAADRATNGLAAVPLVGNLTLMDGDERLITPDMLEPQYLQGLLEAAKGALSKGDRETAKDLMDVHRTVTKIQTSEKKLPEGVPKSATGSGLESAGGRAVVEAAGFLADKVKQVTERRWETSGKRPETQASAEASAQSVAAARARNEQLVRDVPDIPQVPEESMEQLGKRLIEQDSRIEEVRDLKPEFQEMSPKQIHELFERESITQDKYENFALDAPRQQQMRVFKIEGSNAEILVPEELHQVHQTVRVLRQGLLSENIIVKEHALRLLNDPASSFHGQILPEDLIAAFRQLPDAGRAVKQVLLNDKPSPTDTWRTHEYWSKQRGRAFVSAGNADAFDQAINIFPAAGTSSMPLHELMNHEWAHLLEKISDKRRLFGPAVEMETAAGKSYFHRKYATYNSCEDWAVHLGEVILGKDADPFHDMINQARESGSKFKVLLMVHAVHDTLVESERLGSKMIGHDELKKRLEFAMRELGPTAQQELVEGMDSTKDGPTRRHAVQLLGAIGDKAITDTFFTRAGKADHASVAGAYFYAGIRANNGVIPHDSLIAFSKTNGPIMQVAMHYMLFEQQELSHLLSERVETGELPRLYKEGKIDVNVLYTLTIKDETEHIVDKIVSHLQDAPQAREQYLLALIKEDIPEQGRHALKLLEASSPSKEALERLGEVAGDNRHSLSVEAQAVAQRVEARQSREQLLDPRTVRMPSAEVSKVVSETAVPSSESVALRNVKRQLVDPELPAVVLDKQSKDLVVQDMHQAPLLDAAKFADFSESFRAWHDATIRKNESQKLRDFCMKEQVEIKTEHVRERLTRDIARFEKVLAAIDREIPDLRKQLDAKSLKLSEQEFQQFSAEFARRSLVEQKAIADELKIAEARGEGGTGPAFAAMSKLDKVVEKQGLQLEALLGPKPRPVDPSANAANNPNAHPRDRLEDIERKRYASETQLGSLPKQLAELQAQSRLGRWWNKNQIAEIEAQIAGAKTEVAKLDTLADEVRGGTIAKLKSGETSIIGRRGDIRLVSGHFRGEHAQLKRLDDRTFALTDGINGKPSNTAMGEDGGRLEGYGTYVRRTGADGKISYEAVSARKPTIVRPGDEMFFGEHPEKPSYIRAVKITIPQVMPVARASTEVSSESLAVGKVSEAPLASKPSAQLAQREPMISLAPKLNDSLTDMIKAIQDMPAATRLSSDQTGVILAQGVKRFLQFEGEGEIPQSELENIEVKFVDAEKPSIKPQEGHIAIQLPKSWLGDPTKIPDMVSEIAGGFLEGRMINQQATTGKAALTADEIASAKGYIKQSAQSDANKVAGDNPRTQADLPGLNAGKIPALPPELPELAVTRDGLLLGEQKFTHDEIMKSLFDKENQALEKVRRQKGEASPEYKEQLAQLERGRTFVVSLLDPAHPGHAKALKIAHGKLPDLARALVEGEQRAGKAGEPKAHPGSGRQRAVVFLMLAQIALHAGKAYADEHAEKPKTR